MGLLNLNFLRNAVSRNLHDKERLPRTENNGVASDTNPVGNIVLAQRSIGMPIDAVYEYLKQDFEKMGYNDAISGTDNSSEETVKYIVKSGLNMQIEHARLRYEDELDTIAVYIELMRHNGLLKAEMELEAKAKIYNKHLSILDKMGDDKDEGNHCLLYMYESYKRGFLRGLTDVAQKL